MSIQSFIRSGGLSGSLVLGYYGGGNYGDELLLEVLQNLCAQAGVRAVTIGYRNADRFHEYHHDLGYAVVDTSRKKALLRAVLQHKRIVIGGGGLWGLDFNTNVLLLCALLLCSRWVLRKQIYLLGVGYYRSTTRAGHIGAWMAAKAAAAIFARDQESYNNFARYNRRHTILAEDLAWSIRRLNRAGYRSDEAKLEAQLAISGKAVFVALRRFRAPYGNSFTETVEAFIAANPDRQCIVAVFEPEPADPQHYETVRTWQKKYENVHLLLGPHNPLAIYSFLERRRAQLCVIAPQFHVILCAHLAGVPFLPVVYDNKVAQLLAHIGQMAVIPIGGLRPAALQRFTDAWYGGAV